MHLHYRLKTHKIITLTGPYRYVRNPIYSATRHPRGDHGSRGPAVVRPDHADRLRLTYHMTVLYEEGPPECECTARVTWSF